MTKEEMLLKLKEIKSDLARLNSDTDIIFLSERSQHTLENVQNSLDKIIKENNTSKWGRGTLALTKRYVDAKDSKELKHHLFKKLSNVSNESKTLAEVKKYSDGTIDAGAWKNDERPWRTYSVEILKGNGETVWVPVSGQNQAMTVQYALHYYKKNTGDTKAKIKSVKEIKED